MCNSMMFLCMHVLHVCHSSVVHCCDNLLTCVQVRMCGRGQCVSVMRECLLVLAPIIFNPSPEARISSALSHRPLLSLAEHLARQALINTGMAILSVTEGGWQWGTGVSMRRGKRDGFLVQPDETILQKKWLHRK